MVEVEEARKAVQLIQYSIRGMAELYISGEIQNVGEELISDAALCVLRSASVLDLYLTGETSTRRVRVDSDAQGALLFVSTMAPFRFPLSSPGNVLTFSWPRDGAEIFHLEGEDEDVHSRWRDLFSDGREDGAASGPDPADVPEA